MPVSTGMVLAHRESGQLERAFASRQQVGQSRIPGDRGSNHSQIATDLAPDGSTAERTNGEREESQCQEEKNADKSQVGSQRSE